MIDPITQALHEAHMKVLANMDEHIAKLEEMLANAQAERREYINRHNLNPKNPAGTPRG